MNAQLSNHRWEDRVLLLFADSSSDSLLTKQLAHFQADKAGLKNRDLVIYQLFESEGIAPNGEKMNQEKVAKFWKKYSIKGSEFVVVLIGKDGGEKLRMTEILSREKLYDTIDVMPMRRAEMKRKG